MEHSKTSPIREVFWTTPRFSGSENSVTDPPINVHYIQLFLPATSFLNQKTLTERVAFQKKNPLLYHR